MKGLRLLLALALAGLGLAEAKSYRLARVEQDVYLEADGTVRVEDTRTFAFEGSFSEAFLTVDPIRGGRVRFGGVEALDGKAAANPRVSGNTVTWNATATDESRTFRIRYSLTGEVTVARDAAQFDRQVLEPEHAPVDAYTVRLHAPAPSPDLFRVFVFTGRSRIGRLDFDPARRVATVRLAPVSEDEFVRTRVILSPRGFTGRTTNADRLEGWLAEVRRETQGFRDASRGALERGGFAPPPPPPPAWLLALPWLVALLVLQQAWEAYRRHGREPATAEVGRYYREPAETVPPAVVPYLLTQNNPGRSAAGPAVAATLLDFARRGHLELVPHESPGFLGLGRSKETRFRLKGPPDSSAPPFERELYAALRAADNGDGTVSPAELRAHLKSHPSFVSKWASAPREWYERTHGRLLDPSSWRGSAPVLLAAFGLGVGALVLGFSMLDARPALAGSLIGAGFLLVIVGILAASASRRWMPGALLNARRWRAYRNFLADFSQMETAPAEHYKLWDYHLVYATALGVAERYLRNLRRVMEREPDAFFAPTWTGSRLTSVSTVSSLESLGNLAEVSSNLSALESALSPSSSGSGGGFGGSSSGGSSGGGGSSGAR
jgi:uncharacterized membrane protein YgcG